MESALYFIAHHRLYFIGKSRENPYIECMSNFNALRARSMDGSDAGVSEHLLDPGVGAPGVRPIVVVPIRSLAGNQRSRIAAHLLGLDVGDRYLRFGYAASDEQVGRYAAGLDFEHDEVFGVFNRKLALIAFAHLAYPRDKAFCDRAEFGVSVTKANRGRGYGARLFERAAMHARNDGITQLYIHALSENTAMLKIARDAGAVVTRDGSESDALLCLAPATLDSHVSEIVQEQFAQADYRMKQQARQFSAFLGGLRDSVALPRDGR